MKKKMKYYNAYGREITFREAQRLIGPLRNGAVGCINGCCYGSYDNLAQFVAQAKRRHTEIVVDPEGPSVYAR